jgi:hypothetical protein
MNRGAWRVEGSRGWPVGVGGNGKRDGRAGYLFSYIQGLQGKTTTGGCEVAGGSLFSRSQGGGRRVRDITVRTRGAMASTYWTNHPGGVHGRGHELWRGQSVSPYVRPLYHGKAHSSEAAAEAVTYRASRRLVNRVKPRDLEPLVWQQHRTSW